MFNEILTGKQTLDQPPVSMDPYRVESVPEVSVMCVSCLEDFKTKVQNKDAMRCPPCHVSFVEANQAASARALREAEGRFEKSRRDRRLYVLAIGAFFAIAGAFTRYQMKKDFAEAWGHKSESTYVGSYSDDYSYALYNFSGDACRCQDLKCGRDVQIKVDQFLKRAPGPSSDTASEQGSKSLEAIADCLGKLESQ
jgi:hypothetical protein